MRWRDEGVAAVYVVLFPLIWAGRKAMELVSTLAPQIETGHW